MLVWSLVAVLGRSWRAFLRDRHSRLTYHGSPDGAARRRKVSSGRVQPDTCIILAKTLTEQGKKDLSALIDLVADGTL